MCQATYLTVCCQLRRIRATLTFLELFWALKQTHIEEKVHDDLTEATLVESYIHVA